MADKLDAKLKLSPPIIGGFGATYTELPGRIVLTQDGQLYVAELEDQGWTGALVKGRPAKAR